MRVKFDDISIKALRYWFPGVASGAAVVFILRGKPSFAIIAAGTAWILARVFNWK